MRRCVIIIITVLALFDFQRLPAQRWLPASPWHVRTNLVHDVLLVPNLGVEYELSDRWSLVADVSGAWWSAESRNRRWHILTGEVEMRRWLGWRFSPPYFDGGHHLGFYAAVYRYDLEWGGTGQQGELNYGGGISYGYALPSSASTSPWASATWEADIRNTSLPMMGATYRPVAAPATISDLPSSRPLSSFICDEANG